jgi:segregation and condensation protein A
MARDRLGQHFFARGMPEMGSETPPAPVTATLYDLLSAYARQRQKVALSHLTLGRRMVWSLAEAREALERLIGVASEWTALDQFLIQYVVDPSMRATVIASSFSATLELVREGKIEMQQTTAFAPLWVRRRAMSPPQNGGNRQ